ncbi:MAG: phenylalanine--tRNA ligase subunit beta, partial [Chloroflexi bacterium]|nr:phenylalanine--tRNA ligase subunit beta [Chloroflexota bacterium]
MKVSLKWLREYVPITLPPEELAHRLTMAGIEVGEIHTVGGSWDSIFVGRVARVIKHPNADRLTLCTVDLPNETFEVVCGAPNVAEGQNIAFAKLGARLLDGHSGKTMTLKAAKIRGVVSQGMICSEKELGLSDEHEGILVLSPDAPLGASLIDH